MTPEALSSIRKDYLDYYLKLANNLESFRNKRNRSNMIRAFRLSRASMKWANEFFIDEIYHLAELRSKLTGVPFQVDHIYPLSSKWVSGLHNEFNLQVIPKVMNNYKSNKDSFGFIPWSKFFQCQ